MVHLWDDYEENLEKLLKDFPHLRPELVQAGLAYGKKYRQEEPPSFWGGGPLAPRGAMIVPVQAVPNQMFATRSKYSSSSFFPPHPFPSILWLSTNSIDRIHFTILYPSWFSTRSRSGAPWRAGSG